MYLTLQRKLKRSEDYIKPTPKEQKLMASNMRTLEKKHADIAARALSLAREKQLEQEIRCEASSCTDEWNTSVDWLVREGYMDARHELTLKGKASSQMSDGHPLIRGAILSEGLLDDLSFVELAGWLACFANPPQSCRSFDAAVQAPPHMARSFELAEAHGVQLQDARSIVSAWTSTRDLNGLSVDYRELGAFVKLVLRVVSFIDELSPILLGLEKYELLNRLHGHHEKLMAGIVTNASLYM
jgi:superfamily II RNA helicase